MIKKKLNMPPPNPTYKMSGKEKNIKYKLFHALWRAGGQ